MAVTIRLFAFGELMGPYGDQDWDGARHLFKQPTAYVGRIT